MRWLFLRGLVREARHWGPFPARFAQAVGAPAPWALDLPGVGTEAGRPVPLSIAQMTDDVRARFLARPDREEGPWSLLAISLGGMIALDWLARYPEDFERGVVINTSAGDAGRVWERFSFRQLPTVARCFFADPLLREQRILQMTSSRAAAELAATAELFAGYAREVPVTPTVALRQLFAASRSRLPRQLATPTLVLASRGDRLVDHRCSERIAARLRLPIQLHEDAGHDLPLDAPDWVIARVTEWLAPAAGTTRPLAAAR